MKDTYKYTEKIRELVKNFNEDFEKSLLADTPLLHLACAAFEENEDVTEEWYSSELNMDAEFHELFRCIKQVYNPLLVPKVYIHWTEQGLLLGPGGQPTHLTEEQTAIVSKLYNNWRLKDRHLLAVMKSCDINQDDIKDVTILSVFDVSRDFQYVQANIKRFVTYPEHYFTSPIIGRYLDVHLLKNEIDENLKRSKLELSQINTRIYSYGHIIFNSLSGNLNDFISIEKKDQHNTSLSEVSIAIGNIKKRSKIIQLMLHLFARKGNETIEEFKEITTLGQMVDFLRENWVMYQSRAIDFDLRVPEVLSSDITGQQELIFSLLWNLLKNADKHNYDIRINPVCCFQNVDGWLQILITNTANQEDFIELDQKLNSEEDTSSPQKGMWAVRNHVKELGWGIAVLPEGIDFEEDIFPVTIQITTKINIV
jgi:hypothetical protein